MGFSVLILTLNEAANLNECLRSVSVCDDVVVLDSFSQDETKEIALSRGVRFYQRRFDDFASQRNYANTEIKFKYPWVFHLDADERLTPELFKECEMAIRDSKYDGYLAAAKVFFMGRWIKHSTDYPVYQARLVRVSKFRFEQAGHGQREIQDMRLGKLSNAYLHYPFSKGIADWITRHNNYSSKEAAQNLKSENIPFSDIFGASAIARRRALKKLGARLPFKPTLRFLYQYFLRFGFLDGYAGLCYCRLLSMYEFMTVVKQRESRCAKR
jgi:glycosyltransferase involved in cell wall biosynthesis